MTQDDLAERLGVHRMHISRIENGHQIPRRNLMRKIKSVTGGKVTAADFYDSEAA